MKTIKGNYHITLEKIKRKVKEGFPTVLGETGVGARLLFEEPSLGPCFRQNTNEQKIKINLKNK